MKLPFDFKEALRRLHDALGMRLADDDPYSIVNKGTLEIMKLRGVVSAAELPLEGCGDGSCVIAPPKGQHTNAGCRCDERRLRRAVQVLKARVRVQPEET